MPASRAVETVALFGLPISNVTMAEAVARIDKFIESGEAHQIATANLDFARNALRDEELQRVICDCSMVLPDGAPMLWASRLLGKPLKQRVTGVDLVPQLAKLSADKGHRIFLLGSSDESSSSALKLLEERFPGVQFCGRYSPPISPIESMDNILILRQIRFAEPAILLVAFGNPKQELWIHRFKEALGVPVMIGIGGSLEMISGQVRRAPLAFQRLNLEWFYRMAQEPGRLLPRYIADAAALARHLPVGFAVHQMQPNQLTAGELQVSSRQAVREVVLPSRLSGAACHLLSQEVKQAIAHDQNLLVKMRAVQRVDPDGLGCLMEARRLLHGRGLTLWLTELSPIVLRVLEYSSVKELFLIAETTQEAVRLSTIGIPESESNLHGCNDPMDEGQQRANVA